MQTRKFRAISLSLTCAFIGAQVAIQPCYAVSPQQSVVHHSVAQPPVAQPAAASQQAAQQAAPEYAAGLQYFSAGRYAEAVAFFQQAVQRHPYSALVHYNFANALVKMKAHDRAMQEYKIAYLLEPRGAVSTYCQIALVAYKAKVPTLAEAAAYQHQIHLRDTAGGARGDVSPVMDAAAVLGITDADRAREAIRRQLSQEKVRHGVKGNAAANSVEDVARQKIQQVDRDTERKISDLYAPIIEIIDEYGRVKRVANVLYNPYNFANPHINLKPKEAQIKADGEAAKAEILREAKLDKERHAGWVKNQESALDEVANNLTAQFDSKSKSGVKLHARGTNLYVRQYAPFVNKASQNARPAIVRIVRAGSQPAEESAPEETLTKPNVRNQITQ